MSNLVCKECGGTSIEEKGWIDPNTNTIVGSCGNAEDNFEDQWCRNCEKHVEFISEEEFKVGVKDE